MAVCVSWCRDAKSSIGDLPLLPLLLTVVEQPRREGTRPLPTTDDGGATIRAATDLKSTELREHLPSHTNRLIPCIAIAIQFNRCASSTRGRAANTMPGSLFLTVGDSSIRVAAIPTLTVPTRTPYHRPKGCA